MRFESTKKVKKIGSKQYASMGYLKIAVTLALRRSNKQELRNNVEENNERKIPKMEQCILHISQSACHKRHRDLSSVLEDATSLGLQG